MQNRHLMNLRTCFIGALAVFACAIFVAPTLSARNTNSVPAKFSSEGLKKLDQQIAADITANKYPGAVYYIASGGKIVHSGAVGLANVESKQPVTENTIFRLASMSKPITAVAVMILVEEGKIGLDDPVSRFIPEFKAIRVGPLYADPNYPVDIAEITIRNLLTHTAGFDADMQVSAAMYPVINQKNTLAERIPMVAKYPVKWKPGTHWQYSALIGFETLSRVVEVVSGMPFDLFLKTRIFDPLGMKNTTFVMTNEQKTRLVRMYDTSKGNLMLSDNPGFGSDTYFSGAAGLYGTAYDYTRFALMLSGHGALGKVRILQPKTVDLMGSEIFSEDFPGLFKGTGWGLGMRHITSNSDLTKGSYGWSGAFGTHFWVDPEKQIVGVFMINLSNAGGAGAPTAFEYERLVMQAISK